MAMQMIVAIATFVTCAGYLLDAVGEAIIDHRAKTIITSERGLNFMRDCGCVMQIAGFIGIAFAATARWCRWFV